MNRPDLSIVLPCYNESKNIPLIVDRLSKFQGEVNFELVLVNNGSTDDSEEVLKGVESAHSFVNMVRIAKNMGYGHGIFTGLKSARADIVAYSHADIQTPPEDVIRAYRLLKGSNRDIEKVMIKGLRVNRRKEEAFLTRSLAKVVEVVLGYKMEDINGQPKMFSRRLLEDFKSPPTDFSFDVYVMYMARLSGLELITFPVDFGLRIHGESKWSTSISKKYKTIAKYLLSIVKIARSHYDAPNNLLRQATRFLAAGVFTNITNYATFILLLRYIGVHYLISSASGFIAGFLLGFFLNRSWTFSASAGNVKMQMPRFLIVNMVSLIANLIAMWFSTAVVGIIPEISQLISIGVSTVINFTGSKLWVFKEK